MTCERCNGNHWVWETDGDRDNPRPCICIQIQSITKFLKPIGRHIKAIKSDLYTEEKDYTHEDVFLKGSWQKIGGHLKYVLYQKYNKNRGFTYKMVTDDQLLRVWLGADSYSNKSRSVRDSVRTYNSLKDFLEDSDLIIVRLGVVEKNARLPEVILETIKIRRRHLGMPIWVTDEDGVMQPGCAAYSPKLYGYLQREMMVKDVSHGLIQMSETQANTFDDEISIGLDEDLSTLEEKKFKRTDSLLEPPSARTKKKPKTKKPNGLPEF